MRSFTSCMVPRVGCRRFNLSVKRAFRFGFVTFTGRPWRPAEATNTVEHFLFRQSPRRELLEGSRHKRPTIRIRHQALARPFRGVEIANRRNKRPAALFERGSHSRARPLGSYVIVELRESG